MQMQWVTLRFLPLAAGAAAAGQAAPEPLASSAAPEGGPEASAGPSAPEPSASSFTAAFFGFLAALRLAAPAASAMCHQMLEWADHTC